MFRSAARAAFAFALAIAAVLIAPGPILAQEAPVLDAPADEIDAGTPALMITPAGDQQLGDFLWLARLIVVFADSPADPRFIQQMEYLKARPQDLIDRDVVVITDTDPAAKSPIREALRPRGFDLVLIGKDGAKYLRKPTPWDVREISRSIDKMPDRQQELRDLRAQ